MHCTGEIECVMEKEDDDTCLNNPLTSTLSRRTRELLARIHFQNIGANPFLAGSKYLHLFNQKRCVFFIFKD